MLILVIGRGQLHSASQPVEAVRPSCCVLISDSRVGPARLITRVWQGVGIKEQQKCSIASLHEKNLNVLKI